MMETGMHFDPSKTSAHAASYTSQRIFYAEFCLQDFEVEEWEVLGVYPVPKLTLTLPTTSANLKGRTELAPTPAAITK